jgi:Holliday junction resolvase RusA-like endonuclease
VAGDAMNESEHFIIPGLPPTTNHCYGLTVKGGKAVMYKTQAAKDWQEMASLIINTQQKHQDWSKVSVAVDITFHCHRPVKRDVDGGIKITLDTVAAALGFNDSKVVWLQAGKDKADAESEEQAEIMVNSIEVRD